MRVAIIGTAGRREDAARMRWGLFCWMVDQAQLVIPDRFQAPPSQVVAVSGGAAWADHVAVVLFLEGWCPGLELHLPAILDERTGRFRDVGDGAVANHYHEAFSVHAGRDTLADLFQAIKKGAEFRFYGGFKSRNLAVADTDALLAFTFGKGGPPTDSGTAHTWRASKAKARAHISLDNAFTDPAGRPLRGQDRFCQPWVVALRHRYSVCNDEECELSGGMAHVGDCMPCACGLEHASYECPAGAERP